LVTPAGAKEPGEQALHVVDGFESRSALPATHWGQLVLPREENVPALHATQGVDGALSVSAFPDAQIAHTRAFAGAYEPAMHA
jgi:hypothetical protein